MEAWGDCFEVVTGDAGLAAAENATLVRALGKHYLIGLKGNQPTLHGHEVETLADKRCAPQARTAERVHGLTLVREVWTHALSSGEVDFPGARLLLCVRQTHPKDDDTQSVEWRYFVTSLSTGDLSFHHLLSLVRLHWVIENRHHWTLDLVLEEDDRQPCLHSRTALEVTAWLRVLAYNLISSWRAALPSRTGCQWPGRAPARCCATRSSTAARSCPCPHSHEGLARPPPLFSNTPRAQHGRPAERRSPARRAPPLRSPCSHNG